MMWYDVFYSSMEVLHTPHFFGAVFDFLFKDKTGKNKRYSSGEKHQRVKNLFDLKD